MAVPLFGPPAHLRIEAATEDGRDAVIKLQRPNIRQRMTTDLRILHRLARTLEKHAAFAKNANAVAIQERGDAAIGLGFPHEAEEHVVVPVEDDVH